MHLLLTQIYGCVHNSTASQLKSPNIIRTELALVIYNLLNLILMLFIDFMISA